MGLFTRICHLSSLLLLKRESGMNLNQKGKRRGTRCRSCKGKSLMILMWWYGKNGGQFHKICNEPWTIFFSCKLVYDLPYKSLKDFFFSHNSKMGHVLMSCRNPILSAYTLCTRLLYLFITRRQNIYKNKNKTSISLVLNSYSKYLWRVKRFAKN